MLLRLCLGEREVPTVVMVIEGGYATLEAAGDAIKADIPVLVFAGSGRAADFLAAAYDRREQPLVLQTLRNIYLTGTIVLVNIIHNSANTG